MKELKGIKRLLVELFFLFSFGGFFYSFIEIGWRGYTHWTMWILGGVCFIVVGLLNENQYTWEMPLILQIAISTISITLLELFAGIILNIILKLNIWDYSQQPFNFLGQICPLYSFFWSILSFLAILLDDYIRWFVFDEEKPKYY